MPKNALTVISFDSCYIFVEFYFIKQRNMEWIISCNEINWSRSFAHIPQCILIGMGNIWDLQLRWVAFLQVNLIHFGLNNHLYSSIASGRVGAEYPPSKKIAKNWKREGKRRENQEKEWKKSGKRGKIGKKRQKSERFFHFAPPDREGWLCHWTHKSRCVTEYVQIVYHLIL